MRRTEVLDNGQLRRIFHWSETEPDQFVIQTQENIDAVRRKVQEQRESRERAPLHEMRHVAEIPMTVIERAVREGWIHDSKAWAKFLNDPENQHLRVQGGRV